MNESRKERGSSGRQRGRVIADHQASYPDPISVQAGEELYVSGKEDNWRGWIWLWCENSAGKSGWVPRGYVERRDEKHVARYDYDAIELSVRAGEEVTLEKEESGWFWCVNQAGKSGWVPAEKIERAPL